MFAIKDHHAPDFIGAATCVNDMFAFLAADEENVIAVHCKAGKGRTGTMISCLMLQLNLRVSAEGAMHCFAFTRSQTGKSSVDNPS